MQFWPGIFDGFLAGAELDLAPFRSPGLKIATLGY
jgi:hypothetical protein